jgi:peptide deformylase
MEKISLLQHGELEKVAPTSESKFKRINFESLFNISREICEACDFGALAMNQIPQPILKQYLNGDIYYRVIFLRPESEGGGESSVEQDTLIFNPEIKFRRGIYLSLEGCGSIDKGRTLQVVKRPANFSLDGLFYTEGMEKPEYKKVISKKIKDLNATQHEVDHLNGYTALSFPKRLVSFEDKHINRKTLRRIVLINQREGIYFSKNGKIKRVGLDEINNW